MSRQLQNECVATLLRQMNELAANFRENRPKIETFRKQLLAVKRVVVEHDN